MRQPVAFITGITGQDGSYLTDLLLEKGYEVHGIIRRSSSFNTGRLEHCYDNPNLHLHYGDLTDALSMERLLDKIWPDEVYNLGSQSHVRVSFDQPVYTADTVFMGTLRLLEAIRNSDCNPRFYQASSSEMFGDVLEPRQDEDTPFNPRSPYACAKVAAHYTTINYREAYDLHASCGILFNHESPRRGETFVTRKISKAVAKIALGQQKELVLGNIHAQRDWGYAPDYVRAMWMMLQRPEPGDYVVATGETHSVEEFVQLAFGVFHLDSDKYVRFDKRYERPTEVDLLLGNPLRAKTILGWEPSISFPALVHIMVSEDYKQLTGHSL